MNIKNVQSVHLLMDVLTPQGVGVVNALEVFDSDSGHYARARVDFSGPPVHDSDGMTIVEHDKLIDFTRAMDKYREFTRRVGHTGYPVVHESNFEYGYLLWRAYYKEYMVAIYFYWDGAVRVISTIPEAPLRGLSGAELKCDVKLGANCSPLDIVVASMLHLDELRCAWMDRDKT